MAALEERAGMGRVRAKGGHGYKERTRQAYCPVGSVSVFGRGGPGCCTPGLDKRGCSWSPGCWRSSQSPSKTFTASDHPIVIVSAHPNSSLPSPVPFR
jgi:hypothetical protein